MSVAGLLHLKVNQDDNGLEKLHCTNYYGTNVVQILNIAFKTTHSMYITLVRKFKINRNNILPKSKILIVFKPLMFNKVLNTTGKRPVAYFRKPLTKDIFVKIRQPFSSSHQKHP